MSGSQVEINNFREAFERGEDPLADVTDASDINSVAGVFKLYLRELREPLFPILFFDQFMQLARKILAPPPAGSSPQPLTIYFNTTWTLLARLGFNLACI